MTTELIANAGTPTDSPAAVVVTVLLLALLIAKQGLVAVPDRRGEAVAKVLDVVLVPFLIAFAATVAAGLLPTAP